MEFQILKMYYEGTGTWFNIEPISDIHVGARFHDKKKLAEVVERIKNDPNRYTSSWETSLIVQLRIQVLRQ